jgi:chemotaxis response regulator CheB
MSAETRVVLATADGMFAALCRHALARAHTSLKLVAAVAPAELLPTVRKLAPALLVMDADGEDLAALRALAAKVMLVSDARIVLVSAWLAPGSPALCALLQSIAATFVQKPDGGSSLGLVAEGGPPFVAALEAAFAAHEADPLDLEPRPRLSVLPVDFDAGWSSEGEPPRRANGR